MLSNKKIICPTNLINVAKKLGAVDAAIAPRHHGRPRGHLPPRQRSSRSPRGARLLRLDPRPARARAVRRAAAQGIAAHTAGRRAGQPVRLIDHPSTHAKGPPSWAG